MPRGAADGTSFFRRLKQLLCHWLVADPRRWCKLVNAPQTEAEMEAIRRCVARGQSYGGEDWVRRTAGQLELESTLRAPQRPRKLAAIDEPQNKRDGPPHRSLLLPNASLVRGVLVSLARAAYAEILPNLGHHFLRRRQALDRTVNALPVRRIRRQALKERGQIISQLRGQSETFGKSHSMIETYVKPLGNLRRAFPISIPRGTILAGCKAVKDDAAGGH